MTILDKLMEKKDLRVYCIWRIKELKQQRHDATKAAPIKRRELVHGRFQGREGELKRIIGLLAKDEIKSEAIRMYKKLQREAAE